MKLSLSIFLSFLFFTVFSDNGHFSSYVEPCFTPYQKCAPKIIEHLEKAQKSIYVRAYSFTSKPILEALIKARKRNVEVFVLIDKSQAKSKYAVEKNLQAHNIFVKQEDAKGLAHNKVIVIDESLVITGSYNFSNAAETRNKENVLFVFDPKVAVQYLEDWKRALL
jgi:phospholipase D